MPVVLGNLREIGPVVVDYRNPVLSWVAAPTTHGIQPCTISGHILIAQGHALRELCANPDRQTTVGGFTGVLEEIVMDGDMLAPLSGDYLLQSFNFDVHRPYVFAGRVAFTLAAVFLGDLS